MDDIQNILVVAKKHYGEFAVDEETDFDRLDPWGRICTFSILAELLNENKEDFQFEAGDLYDILAIIAQNRGLIDLEAAIDLVYSGSVSPNEMKVLKEAPGLEGVSQLEASRAALDWHKMQGKPLGDTVVILQTFTVGLTDGRYLYTVLLGKPNEKKKDGVLPLLCAYSSQECVYRVVATLDEESYDFLSQMSMEEVLM